MRISLPNRAVSDAYPAPLPTLHSRFIYAIASMPYTTTDKQQALELWQTAGTAETARRTGINGRTLTRWAKAAGLMTEDRQQKTTELRAAAAEKVSEVWADYRSKEAAASGATASRMRNAILEQVEGEPIMETVNGDQVQVGVRVDGRNLQSLAVAYGILVDKAELLSGNATARIDTWATSEVDTALKDLVVEMEDTIRTAAAE